MSVIDELRRMLDERGVKWHEATQSKVKWFSPVLNGPVAVSEWRGRLVLDAGYVDVTPEQAIAATLGGTCETCPQMDNPDSFIRHLMGRETCELEELARDMYKAIVMMIAVPSYADAHRSELEAIDDRAHSLGVVAE